VTDSGAPLDNSASSDMSGPSNGKGSTPRLPCSVDLTFDL